MIDKLTNANAYLNGQTLLGKIIELDLPEVKQKMTDYKALGMSGDIEIPAGFEKMELKIKWGCFYLKEFLQMANFTNITNITVRGNIETYSSVGRVEQKGVIITLNGIVKQIPLGKYKQNEVVDLETVMTIYGLTILIDNVPLLLIDVFTNTFKVGVLSLLDGMNKNQ